MKLFESKNYNRFTTFDHYANRIFDEDVSIRKFKMCINFLRALANKLESGDTFTSSDFSQIISPNMIAAMAQEEHRVDFAPWRVREQVPYEIHMYDNVYRKVTYNIYEIMWTPRQMLDFADAVEEYFGLRVGA